MFKKGLKYLLIFVLLLVVLLVAGSYYFLGTNSGLKSAISLANRYSGYEVSAARIEGNALGRTELKKVHVKGKNLEFSSDSVLLDWQSKSLLDKSLVVKAIAIDGASVMIIPPAEQTTETPSQPFSLSDIDLPIDIQLEDLLVTNLVIKNPANAHSKKVATGTQQQKETGDIVIDKIQLGVDYIGQKAVIHTLEFHGFDAQLKLTGEATTKGEYPLHLESVTDYRYNTFGENIDVVIDGALKDTLTLTIHGKGVSDFQLNGQLSSLFDVPAFDGKLVLETFDSNVIGMVDTTLTADLAVKGNLGKSPTLVVKGEAFYNSPDTDALQLTLDGDFDGKRAVLSDFTLDLLTAKQQLSGRGRYVLSDKSIDVAFTSPLLHWPQSAVKPSVVLKDSVAQITGALDNYDININSQGHIDAVGAVDVVITGKGNESELKQFDAKGLFNRQPITLTGRAKWQPTIAYQASMKADKITPFNQLPGVEKLNIVVQGNDKTYTAKGGGRIYRDDIPPSTIQLSVNGTPSTLDNADVTINTLGGEIALRAKGKLAPLNIVADVDSHNIQPQTFFPDFRGHLNHQLQVTASQTAGNLVAEATLENLSGDLQGYPLSGKGSVRFEQGKQRIDVNQLNLDVAGNTIDANGVLFLTEDDADSDLTANIDAKYLGRLLPDLSGAVTANVVAKGSLKTPEFKASVNAEHIVYQTQKINQITALATVQADTESMKLTADGEVFYDSPTTDKIKLTLNGDFDGKQVNLSTLVVDLLTAKQQLTGQGEFSLGDKAINISLNSPKLHWPQASQRPEITLSKTALSVTGTLDDYHVDLNTLTDSIAVGQMPVRFSGDGDLSALKDFTAQVKLNNQPINLDGKMAWSPAVGYQVRVRAGEVPPFKSYPGVKNLDITVDGDDKAYRGKGRVYLYADNIPPADIALTIAGTPSELTSANVRLNSLGGVIRIDGKGAFSPLDMTATINSNNLQPHTFYGGPVIKSDHTVVVTAKQTADNITVTSVIEKLTGSVDKYPLSGKGTVIYEQASNHLNLNKLGLNLAGNQVDVNGMLAFDANQSSSVKAAVNAPQLRRLMPDLDGAIKGDIALSGDLRQPKLVATISGNNVAYQSNKIQRLTATANADLSSQAIAIQASLNNLSSGNNKINRATVNVDGKLSAHKLSVNVDSPANAAIPSVALSGRGGLDQKSMAWSGQLNQLNITNDMLGRWQLAQHTPLVLSAENVRVQSLCLKQRATALCTDGQLRGNNGGFDVTLKSLSSEQLKPLMPAAIALDTTISGKARIELNNGKPRVVGKLSANGGGFKVNAGSGVLSSKIRQFDTAFALKGNRLESIVQSDLSKIGKIDIAAELADIHQGNVKANIKINNQSLAFIEEILPQVTDVKGHMTGDMTLSGNPSKSLAVAGKVTLHKTDFNVPQFGSEIRGLTMDIFAKNGNTFGFKGQARAGEGNFNIDGELNPATQRGQINVKGKNFQAANSNKLKVTVSPDIRVIFADTIQVRGELFIPKALIVPESAGTKVTVSEDVILPNQAPKEKTNSNLIDAEVTVKLGDDVRVASLDIETRLTGGLKINAKPGKAPKAAGTIEVETGELRIYGQMLNIERGRVIFSNGPIANPSLDIRTTREIDDDDIVVGANVLGTARSPEISLFSTPSMADASILSYLLFGRPPNSDSFGTAALLQTGGMIGANTLARDVRASLGLDVLDFSLTGMEAGKNLSKKVYVGMKSNFFTAINQFLINYKISGRTKVESAISAEEMSVDLIKVIETD